MINYNDREVFNETFTTNIDTGLSPELQWFGNKTKNMPAWKIFKQFGVSGTYENYKKIQYELEYTKDLKSKTILKKYQIFHQNLANFGERGTVQRYEFLCRHIRTTEFNSSHKDAKKIINEILAMLMESADSKHKNLINQIVEGQEELVKSLTNGMLPITAWQHVCKAVSLMEFYRDKMKNEFKVYTKEMNKKYELMIKEINKLNNVQ